MDKRNSYDPRDRVPLESTSDAIDFVWNEAYMKRYSRDTRDNPEQRNNLDPDDFMETLETAHDMLWKKAESKSLEEVLEKEGIARKNEVQNKYRNHLLDEKGEDVIVNQSKLRDTLEKLHNVNVLIDDLDAGF